MKPPISVSARTDNVGTHRLIISGADEDLDELVIVLPQGASAYQSLSAAAPALGDLLTRILNQNGVANLEPPAPPEPAAPAEPAPMPVAPATSVEAPPPAPETKPST